MLCVFFHYYAGKFVLFDLYHFANLNPLTIPRPVETQYVETRVRRRFANKKNEFANHVITLCIPCIGTILELIFLFCPLEEDFKKVKAFNSRVYNPRLISFSNNYFSCIHTQLYCLLNILKYILICLQYNIKIHR